MIHQLLALKRPLIVFDTETTGLDVAVDRVVELGFQVWNAGGLTKEWRSLVNPGIPIPASATKVHKITDYMMTLCTKCTQPRDRHPVDNQGTIMAGGVDGPCFEFKPVPTFKQLAATLAKGFANCDYAGKNVRFDIRILAAEFTRAGIEWNCVGARVVDADRLEQIGDPRSLKNLVRKHLGEDIGSEAHTALGDVQWTTRLIVGQLKTYHTLPHDLDMLHKTQWPGMIDMEGKFRFVDGVPCFSQWGKYSGKPMSAADNGYWDFILNRDFSPEVKALAAAAKMGQFPKE